MRHGFKGSVLREIQEVVSSSLGPSKTFQQVFKERFGGDLPEIINERHRLYIVASSLDSSTERIIEYLSETHGVDINAATFAYFKTSSGELIGRSMLLDEEVVETRAVTRSSSKRKPSPTLTEFRLIAEENGVGDLWDKAFQGFGAIPRIRTGRRPNQLNFNVKFDEGQRPVWMLSIFPASSSEEDGLSVMVHHSRTERYFNLSAEQLSHVCPEANEWNYFTYAFDADRLDRFIDMLKLNAPQA